MELPRTTTELARTLGLSGATVSVHLSTLKRCGMVTSWRSGRRVLYQRTPLALSVLYAVSHPPPPDDTPSLREDPGPTDACGDIGGAVLHVAGHLANP